MVHRFLAVARRADARDIVVLREIAQLLKAIEVSGANLAPAFPSVGGSSAVSPIKNRVCCWSRCWKVPEAEALFCGGLHTIGGQGHVR